MNSIARFIHRGLRRAAFAAACATVAGTAVAADSPFDTDTDGWTAIGDVAGPVTWVAAGGNPDGHIRVRDSVSGGVTYFDAPDEFLGNQSGSFGQMLSFDLMQIFTGSASQFDAADVVLIGGGLTLVYDTASNPAQSAWTHYDVLLTGAGWHVGTLGGAIATDDQMMGVLGALTDLRIRSEYRTGADTGALDNVVLPSVPEPASAALALVGLGLLAGVTHRRRQCLSASDVNASA